MVLIGGTIKAGACVHSDTGCKRSCCIGLLYGRSRLPCEARSIRVAACHTFGVFQSVLSFGGTAPGLVCAVVVVSGLLFLLLRRSPIAGRAACDGQNGTRSEAVPPEIPSYNSMRTWLGCV